MLVIIAVVSITFIGFASPASADAKRTFWFTTGDGQWDGYMKVPSGGTIGVNITDWGSNDALKVRLCSASTGNCTAYKPVFNEPYGHSTQFTNMAFGLYYGDVAKLYGVNRQVTGRIILWRY
ncbi:hypothetical protein MUO14_09405 [Halobacillus shinanisalinarum]|uniref:Uncharacterized protein n=1 Tax=Halobacillus shinanisalinarum TaxID=2932258 RepID=A0ABY4H470_9BACI|nr:hypothetical protein [Halobacillus shinanisalinarum]UOQ95119.1 hypothetical protein MUO14_09405 [Halobacillus shinanisalinarum]